MTQQDKDQQRDDQPARNPDEERRENTGDSSAGSQAATTGYGTGQSQGTGVAPAQHGQQGPSNAGDAGFKADESVRLSDKRTEQMMHADGSDKKDDPDV